MCRCRVCEAPPGPTAAKTQRSGGSSGDGIGRNEVDDFDWWFGNKHINWVNIANHQ